MMKRLAVFVVACLCLVSASYYDALEDGSSELVLEFQHGMDQAPSFSLIAPEFSQEMTEIENDVKSQLSWSLRDVLAKLLSKIHDALINSENIAKDLMVKASELLEKLKSLNVAGEDFKERVYPKIKEWLQVLLNRLQKSSQDYSLIRVPLELDHKNLMENVKQNILERLNIKELIEYVKAKLQKLGQVGEALLEALQRPGALEKIKALLEVLLPDELQGRNYGLGDIWQKVKDFFKGVGVKISDKFYLFADWLKDVSQKAWEQVKDKAGKLKEMAITVSSKAGSMSKKAAEQALEFFREHKSEIGQVVWSLVKGALTSAIASAG